MPGDSTVLLLGAGFSRAISEDMPLTDELGQVALERVGAPTFANSWSFETELSRLAEDQPDLDEAENLANRSKFVRLSAAIAEVLTERQGLVLQRPCPDWLLRFVGVLHARRATAVSFNYDAFLEYAVLAHQLTDWTLGMRVLDFDPVDQLPPWPPGASGDIPRSTFQLLKLHGSLNWWWTPGDSTAATLNSWRLHGAFGTTGDRDDEGARRRLLPGRQRFIVPPTAVKSSYYTNPLTRELWQRAGNALSSATKVCLVGYSLPATDLVVGGLLRHWINSAAVCFVVVNPDPDPVVAQLRRLGFGGNSIDIVDGSAAVPSFVAELERATSIGLATRMQVEEPTDEPVFIAWSPELAVAAIDIRSEDHETVLVGEAVDPGTNAFRPRHGTDPEPLTYRQLLAAVGEGRPLACTVGDRRSRVLVDMATIQRETGIAARCRALVPSEPPGEM